MKTTETLIQIERDAHELRAAYLGHLMRGATAAFKRALAAHGHTSQPSRA